EKRETGTPCVRGNSQAIAFTCATSCGGKTARAARPRAILEPRKPLLMEARSPARDDLRRRLKPARDLGIRQPLCRVQDHLRSLHHLVRQRVAGHPTLKLAPLLSGQHDRVPALPCHHRQHSPRSPPTPPPTRPNLRPGALS